MTHMATFGDLHYILFGENFTFFANLWPALAGIYISTNTSLKFEDWLDIAGKTKLV